MVILSKVIELKANISADEKKDFDKAFNTTFGVFKSLMNEIPCWGLDSIFDKTSAKSENGKTVFSPIDLTIMRNDLYEKTDKSITKKQFDILLRYMYLFLINSGQGGRGAVSAILGGFRCDEVLQDDDYTKLEEKISYDKFSDSDNYGYKVANKLISIGFRNRHPFNVKLTAGERYTVISNVHRQITSWIECDKVKKDDYNSEAEQIASFLDDTPSDSRNDLISFIDYCVDNQIFKNIDGRTHSYFNDCLISAWKSGIEVTRHFYKKADDEISYSLPDAVIEFVKNKPSLWNDEKPLICDKLFILEAILNHNRKHPGAFFPFVKDCDTHRFQYCFGKNYTGYEFNSRGEKTQEIADTVVGIFNKKAQKDVDEKFVNGVSVDHLTLTFNHNLDEGKKFSFDVCTRKQYFNGSYNQSQYFKNLKIWHNEENSNTSLFQFDHKTDSVNAIVREPSIVKRNGNYFVRINLGVLVEPNSLQNDAKWFGMTALPISETNRSKAKDTKGNIDRFDRIKDKTFKILGVDLGQRTPFSWAVGETTFKGLVNDVNIITTGEFPMAKDNTYYQILNDVRNCQRILGVTKSLVKAYFDKDMDEFDKICFNPQHLNTILRAKKKLKASISRVKPAMAVAIQKFIDDKNPISTLKVLIKEVNGDAIQLKTRQDFIVNIMAKYAYTIFNEMKEARRLHFKNNDASTKILNEFNWLNTIDSIKRLKRSQSYFGTDNTRTPISLTHLTDYFNGCKDNFLKTIAASIVKTARDTGCQIIVMERLNNAHADLNKSQQNFMHALWSPARVEAAIVNAASWHGIEVAQVSESQTSQVHFETGKYGYRDRTSLWYTDDKGNLLQTHADMNAAKNIIKKFTTRHGSTTQVCVDTIKASEDKKVVSDSQKEKQNQGKCVKGFLCNNFKTLKEAQEYFAKNFAGHKFVYLNEGRWISKEDKDKLIEAIKTNPKIVALKEADKNAKEKNKEDTDKLIADNFQIIPKAKKSKG